MLQVKLELVQLSHLVVYNLKVVGWRGASSAWSVWARLDAAALASSASLRLNSESASVVIKLLHTWGIAGNSSSSSIGKAIRLRRTFISAPDSSSSFSQTLIGRCTRNLFLTINIWQICLLEGFPLISCWAYLIHSHRWISRNLLSWLQIVTTCIIICLISLMIQLFLHIMVYQV